MEMLKAKNIIIETYLGGDDKIINSQEALVFLENLEKFIL